MAREEYVFTQRGELEDVRSRALHWFTLLSAIAIANLNGKNVSSRYCAEKKPRGKRLVKLVLGLGKNMNESAQIVFRRYAVCGQLSSTVRSTPLELGSPLDV